MAKKRMVTTKSSTINWSLCLLQNLESTRDHVVKAIAQRESGIQAEFNSLTGDVIRALIEKYTYLKA